MFVVCDFCGYGFGCVFYLLLNVLYYGCSGIGLWFEEGMFFIIEFMINLGCLEIKVLVDDWMVVICDKFLFVQFEYFIGVILDGFEIFILFLVGKFYLIYGQFFFCFKYFWVRWKDWQIL